VQTIKAIEDFHISMFKEDVLTRIKVNFVVRTTKMIRLDIIPVKMSKNPSLMMNFLQYTPMRDSLRWFDPQNLDELYLFGGT